MPGSNLAGLGVKTDMPKKKHLIIGSGSAGLNALEQIRRLNSDDDIKIVTSEDFPPYSPTALPYLISGKIDEASLPVKDESYFDRMKATFAKGKKVAQVLPLTKQVVYQEGEKESYDTLLIASGSEATRPDIKGLDKVDYLSFHTLGDFRLLQKQLANKKKVAIYGGGLVAIELAIALLEAGYPVKVIVRSRILRVYFDMEAGKMIKGILTGKGAQIYEGSTIEEIKGNRKGIEMALSDGTTLDTEILIVALGVKPSIPFLSGTDIEVGNGVLVDRRMKTSIENIYAAGDVAEAPDFFTGEPGMNQIIPSAVEQGKIAGSNMAGTEAEYEGWISTNIFNFFGNTAFSAGMSMPTADNYKVLTEKDEHKALFKRLVYDNDRLVGAMFINTELDPGVILYLIQNRIDIGSHKQQLMEQPREISRWLMQEAEHA